LWLKSFVVMAKPQSLGFFIYDLIYTAGSQCGNVPALALGPTGVRLFSLKNRHEL
jgi:hypothetical protein